MTMTSSRRPARALQALKAFQKLGKAQPEDPDIPKHLAWG